MVDVSGLKGLCSDVQDNIQNLDTEVTESLEMVTVLIQGTDDGGVKCILQCLASKLRRLTDISVMECINNLMDLESGLQMFKEEHGEELGVLPGLTDVEVYDEENDEVVTIEQPVKKRGRRKKEDQIFEDNAKSLGDIFNDQEFEVIGKEVFGK